ncbi:uncharacterized protein FOMMEDRAFT_145603 [Fomitiporia mediterranea MF3/22]|uniref:uncharacterized protein n=1 Tax=Fomitiporia mediterranea (strain MF3/22) TaxID=694068 RepID=UPI00044098B5|nr:uncharacterized protein FOMMEDRAFT_145603 [Fomitiporia mediterranea MF3/22]EJD04879.1 hypothetical protein FOMMEDRAFT_145603 [Fomitiporia mediterranea MF3/22]
MYTYLHVRADSAHGRFGDELTFRKTIQGALAQSFGASGAGTYVDVLRFRCARTTTTEQHHSAVVVNGYAHENDVDDAVIRVARDDAPNIKAALAAAPIRLSIVDESHFLPALLASEPLPHPED